MIFWLIGAIITGIIIYKQARMRVKDVFSLAIIVMVLWPVLWLAAIGYVIFKGEK